MLPAHNFLSICQDAPVWAQPFANVIDKFHRRIGYCCGHVPSMAYNCAGSDVALETADIVLLADKLKYLPSAIGLSKKAHGIIKQNLIISLGMLAILVPLTLLGIAHIGPAVIRHEGSTLVLVFNALRLLAYKK